MIGFDERYPNARAQSREAHWPPNVQSISQDGLSYIGVDEEGRLYWDGRKLATSRELKLTGRQGFWALVGVAAAVVLALVELLRFSGLGWG